MLHTLLGFLANLGRSTEYSVLSILARFDRTTVNDDVAIGTADLARGDVKSILRECVRWAQGDASHVARRYSLVLVSRSEVLRARRGPVARIRVGQGMLREKAGVVLAHSAWPESGTFGEVYPGLVLRLHLGFHGRRRPLEISSHIAAHRGLGRCRLRLVHGCWHLWVNRR